MRFVAAECHARAKGGVEVITEATTSKIAEDQLFYCRTRGLSEEDAVNLIVNGFCKEVLKELPMEFAVEAQRLLAVSLEGSVGGGACSEFVVFGLAPAASLASRTTVATGGPPAALFPSKLSTAS
jgi:SUF system FeS cluster assembly, SufBD